MKPLSPRALQTNLTESSLNLPMPQAGIGPTPTAPDGPPRSFDEIMREMRAVIDAMPPRASPGDAPVRGDVPPDEMPTEPKAATDVSAEDLTPEELAAVRILRKSYEEITKRKR